MRTSEQTDKIYPAMFAAVSEVGNIQRNTDNTFFKSKYVALDKLLEAVRPTLTEQGLFILQSPSFEEERVTVETRLVHAESGQWVGVELTAPFSIGKGSTATQAVGSAVTYLRRYGLFSLLGIAETDDDGNSAGNRAEEDVAPKKSQPRQQQQSKPADTVEQWVQGAKNSLDNLRFGTEISQWESANKDNLARLEAKHPEHHKDLMAHKDARVQKLPMRAEAAE